MKITMKDLAKELGVSTVTVSKALSGREGVSETLRQKIKELAEKRGYRKRDTRSDKTTCQAGRTGTRNIGILLSDIFGHGPNSFYHTMHSQLALQLTKLNFSSILEIVAPDMEINMELPSILLGNKTEGIIVLGQLSEQYLDFLSQQNIPLILLDFYVNSEKYVSVTTNNIQGSFMATSHLISCGHKDIGFVGNVRHSTSSIQDRFLGFCKAMLEHGLQIRNEWIIDDRTDKGLILDEFKLPRKLPTAFVCNCDETAYKFIEYLNRLKLSVPEDISIVGFDNTIYSRISKPQITTVAVDVETLVYKAAEMINQRINNSFATVTSVVVPGKMVYRDSVRVIN